MYPLRMGCFGFASGASVRLATGRGFATRPLRLALRSRRRSRPASRISSAEPPGQEWENAARAASSFSRKRRETGTWRRRMSAVSGSAVSRGVGGGVEGGVGVEAEAEVEDGVGVGAGDMLSSDGAGEKRVSPG